MITEQLTSQTGRSPVPREAEGQRSTTSGFWIASAMLFLLIAQSGVPSPLYPIYQQELDLTPAATTAVLSVYICGLLLSLPTVGALSDHVGRRPVIVASAVVSVAALALFASADSLTALLIARALQGIAVGAGMGAAGAAMIDHAPPGSARLAAVLNGALPPAGLAAGALGSGVLAQNAPAPTVTIYLVCAVLISTVAVLALRLREHRKRAPVTWSTLAPRVAVPREVRRIFAVVIGCMISSWALAGLYLGMGPTILSKSLGVTSHIAAGFAIALVTGTGALTGVLGRRRDAWDIMLIGAAALIIGPALTVSALAAHSPWGFYASAPVAGIGFGAAFQGGLRMLLAGAPSEGRAGLLSAVYLISYTAFGLPAVVAGMLVPALGLVPVVEGYAAFVVLVSAVALALQRLIGGRRRGEEIVADAAGAAEELA
ncbi:MFS transporter [Kitasatospora sp. NPDC059571]|uniref:MFS transporter n=1 Tax=Kitasatospora sp. NPDC059571 TaxID=3346871 RepID=UPI0036771570